MDAISQTLNTLV